MPRRNTAAKLRREATLTWKSLPEGVRLHLVGAFAAAQALWSGNNDPSQYGTASLDWALSRDARHNGFDRTVPPLYRQGLPPLVTLAQIFETEIREALRH